MLNSGPRALPLYVDRGISLVRGSGVHLWDSEGRRYLDMMTNYGVNILGHAHPAVDQAVIHQLSQLSNAHQSFDNPTRAALLEALGAILPASLTCVSFANSGSEAVEAALKFARLATGRRRIVSTVHAYHGRTMGALSVTGEERYRQPFSSQLADVTHVAYDDLGALADCMNAEVAAMIVEPIQGEAGVLIPSAGYLEGVQRLCDEHGALLIVDEVQTGFRTGRPLAGGSVRPDILCLSKAVANGFPLGLTITTDEVAAAIPRGIHGSTFAGNPLACAAGVATIGVLTDTNLQAHVESLGRYALEQIHALSLPHVIDARGKGLMMAIELEMPATPVLRGLQAHGVLALPAGRCAIRLLPSVLIQREHVDQLLDALEAELRQTVVRRRRSAN